MNLKYGVSVGLKLEDELFNLNKKLYDKLCNRAENLKTESRIKFFEENPLPLKSKEELEKKLDRLFKYKKLCIDLSSPQTIIGIVDAQIAEIARLLQNGDYLRTGPEWDYAKNFDYEEFDAKYEEWKNKDYNKLLEEIEDYNEKKYYEWKFSGFDEDGFNKWINSLSSKEKEFETES